MLADGVAKVQHYVPQFLLRNFGTGSKRLHVFDKQTGKVFTSSARNLAAESGFYNFLVDGEEHTIEHKLSEAEDWSAPIISRILNSDSLTILTVQDRAQLSLFLGIQMVRTKHSRESLRHIGKLMKEAALRNRSDPAEIQAIERQFAESENELAIAAAQTILSTPKELAPAIITKMWALAATDPAHPFIIGDHPIALQNMIERKNRGNLGVSVPGIEIYMPLSPLRALVMFCQSWAPKLEFLATLEKNRGYFSNMLLAFASGRPMQFHPENTLNFNYLQTRSAERFIMSSKADFSLAEEMIQENSIYREGPRMMSAFSQPPEPRQI